MVWFRTLRKGYGNVTEMLRMSYGRYGRVTDVTDGYGLYGHVTGVTDSLQYGTCTRYIACRIQVAVRVDRFVQNKSYGDLYFLWYKFTHPHVKAMCEAIGNASVLHISGQRINVGI
jgi:hypothetical protein